MRIKPNQNIGDENMMWSMPVNTAATGIVGQKLLYERRRKNGRPLELLVTPYFFVHCSNRAHLYRMMNKNHNTMEPQMEQCVSHVHELVTKPAFKQTVTTTY